MSSCWGYTEEMRSGSIDFTAFETLCFRMEVGVKVSLHFAAIFRLEHLFLEHVSFLQSANSTVATFFRI